MDATGRALPFEIRGQRDVVNLHADKDLVHHRPANGFKRRRNVDESTTGIKTPPLAEGNIDTRQCDNAVPGIAGMGSTTAGSI